MTFFYKKIIFLTFYILFCPMLFSLQCTSEFLQPKQPAIPWYKQNLAELLGISALQQAEHKNLVAQAKQKKEMAKDRDYERSKHIRQTLLELVPNMPEDGIIDIITSYDHGPAVLSLALLDNEQIAAGLENGEIHIFDQNQRRIKVLKSHKAPVYFLTWQLYNQLGEHVLISGSTVYGYPIHSMYNPRQHNFAVKARCQETSLPTSSQQDERLILWNVDKAIALQVINPQPQMWGRFDIVTAKLSPNALLDSKDIQTVASEIHRLVSITTEDQFDSEKPFCLHNRPRIPKEPLVWAKFSKYYVFGYQNGMCAILYQDKPIEFQTHSAPVRVIKEIAPYVFATAADDGYIIIRNAMTQELLQKIDLKDHGPIYALAVREANPIRPQPILFSGSADGSIHMTQCLVENLASGSSSPQFAAHVPGGHEYA